MAGEQTADIRFFDLQSRIGRLRYLAYGLGLTLLALVPALLCVFILVTAPTIGWPLFAIFEIALWVMSIGFMVRRLHDMDKSGWWSLLILVPLVNLIFWLFLIFAPGTIGENRFGAPPPPNSTWVIVGAWSLLLIPLLGGILAAIAIPAYQDFVARAQMSEAVQLVGGGEAPVAEYFQANKAWPADLASVYPAAKETPAGKYVATVTAAVSPDGSAYGIVATMNTTAIHYALVGKAVEVWTADGGKTWHCGPASSNPVNPRYLMGSCRDENPSPP